MKKQYFALIALLFITIPFTQIATASDESLPPFLVDLHIGSIHPDVLLLQKYLNSQGFSVATSGPGSTGHETTYFGKSTKNALAAFQNAHKDEILSPSGLHTGSGNFFSATRNFVNKNKFIPSTTVSITIPSSITTTSAINTSAAETTFLPPPPSLGINITPPSVFGHHRRHISTALIDPSIIFPDTTGLNDGISFPYLVATVNASSNSSGAITYFLAVGDISQFSVNPTTGQVYALQISSSGSIQIGATQAASGQYAGKTVYNHVTVFTLS